MDVNVNVIRKKSISTGMLLFFIGAVILFRYEGDLVKIQKDIIIEQPVVAAAGSVDDAIVWKSRQSKVEWGKTSKAPAGLLHGIAPKTKQERIQAAENEAEVEQPEHIPATALVSPVSFYFIGIVMIIGGLKLVFDFLKKLTESKVIHNTF